MLTIAAVAVFMLSLAAFEARELARRKMWGELVLTSAIWLFATTYAALVMSPFPLINPNRIIINVLDAIYGLF